MDKLKKSQQCFAFEALGALLHLIETLCSLKPNYLQQKVTT